MPKAMFDAEYPRETRACRISPMDSSLMPSPWISPKYGGRTL